MHAHQGNAPHSLLERITLFPILRVKDEDRGVVTFETHVLNQSGEPVMVYVDKLLVKRKK